MANLQDQEPLAHLGVMLEVGIVVTQAVAAIWFYQHCEVRPVAGVAVAAFGLVNAVAIMTSAAFLATAVAVAQDSSLSPEVATARQDRPLPARGRGSVAHGRLSDSRALSRRGVGRTGTPREQEGEGGPTPGGRMDTDRPVVLVSHLPGDGQAETGPAGAVADS